jgi:hypothetical protein
MTGQEINARVATGIFGWKPWRSKNGYFNVEIPGQEKSLSSFGRHCSSAVYDALTGKKLPEPLWWEYIEVPGYAWDLEAAMQVVQKLWAGGNGWEFDLDRSFVRRGDWLASFNNGGVSCEAVEDTAPLAICIAALKTLQPD